MSEPLSLYMIGVLKSRAETDAKAVTKDLLALRKKGPATTEAMTTLTLSAQAKSVEQFMAAENVTKPGAILAVLEFYSAEFDRQLHALFDVLSAAAGTGARHA